jgi:paraquat-inducible protein B
MKRAGVTNQPDGKHLPRPVIRQRQWPYLLVWLAPIAALIAAGFYYFDYRESHGPLITIHFKDASGLKPDETAMNHLGVPVGVVSGIQLSADQRQALVQVRLQRSQEDFARQGAEFWIVRPDFSVGNISGLSTLVSGPYVAATPGSGEKASEFTGLDNPPAGPEDGLKITVRTSELEHLQPNSVVHFRGIDVGVVQSIQLSPDATGVDVQLLIRRNYAPLVRTNTQFWLESGADVKGGLLSGVEVKLDSLRALISGAVDFATPSPAGEPVSDGATFPLRDEPDKNAKTWAPEISLSPNRSEPPEKHVGLENMLSGPKPGGSSK